LARNFVRYVKEDNWRWCNNFRGYHKDVIGIRLEDLAEEDRKKIKGEVMMHELEESSAETLKKKLACFHKTRDDGVKKVTTASFSAHKASKQICSGVFARLFGSHSMNINSDLHVKGQGLVSVLDMKE
jgi:hypothetical protein